MHSRANSQKKREALASELDRHVAEEEEILKQYHVLTDKLRDSRLSVLVNHIVTEEEMHHFLLRTLSDWLRTPPPVGGEGAEDDNLDRGAILRHTETLRGHERKTVEDCRELKAQLSGEDAELFEVVLDAIALDSEKHDRLLMMVQRLLVARPD